MKKNFKYIGFLALGIAFVSCEPKIEGPSFSNGNADFSRYVAVGNSLTAGFADNDLYRSGQLQSFPALIAEQMDEVGGGAFTQPLMFDELGFGNRKKLDYVEDCNGEVSLSPTDMEGQPSAQNFANIADQRPYNNIGVPGARVVEMQFAGYEQFNPYFARFKNDNAATILDHADLINPTFFTLWIGNNDVLGHALNGAAAGTSITGQATFEAAYRGVLTQLTANGAKGVVANIPDITAIPHFTTIPYNALVIDEAQANQLNLLYALNPNVSFQAGANAFVIQDGANVRHMTENELLVLTLPLDDVKCNNYGSILPFRDEHVLTEAEIDELKTAVEGYNATIKTLATEFNVGLVNANGYFNKLAANGISFDGVDFTTTFVSGGVFSLDGIHPTPRGNALIANEFIDAINKKYKANVPHVNAVAYDGVKFPN